MSNLREAYAGTALASLEWSELRERAVDRVAAAGKADPFGIKLWRAKYLLESSAYLALQKELLTIYQNRYRDNATVSQALVQQALHEFLAPACRDCAGRGEMLFDERLIVCETCKGSKIHRYSDEERARTMNISYAVTKKSQHKIRWVLEFMGTHDRKVNGVLSYELERA